MEFDIRGSELWALPSLSYEYESMEPYIDTRTMEIHHQKHHQAYIDNLKKAIDSKGEDWTSIREGVVSIDDKTPMVIRNNAGGHYNHSIFWKMLSPVKKEISKELKEALIGSFSSIEGLKKEFKEKALTRFGSGWVWICSDKDKKLSVHSTANQDNPMMNISSDFEGLKVILGLDLWEHAYYLKYQNRRVDYVDAFWNIVNWDFVQEIFIG